MRSAAHATSSIACRHGRAEIDKRYQKLLTESLKGVHAAERAALVAGVQFMRQSIELPALAKATPASLTALLTLLFEELLANQGA